MLIVKGTELKPGRYDGCVVTVGNFDGVHLGHQALIGSVRRQADELNAIALVYTFDPHPLSLLNPSACPPSLTDFEQKAELLEGLGVDVLVRVRFDREYAGLEPQWFAQTLLGDTLGASQLWVGSDFAFGKGRKGDMAMLRAFGARAGYGVNCLDPVVIEGTRASSTSVRAAISSADFQLAQTILGRPYSLHGNVGRGQGRGMELGFPTANITAREQCLPTPGVYSAWAQIDGGEPRMAAVNVGDNPTFGGGEIRGGGEILVEAHMPGLEGELYGHTVKLRFVSKIRGEIAFASVEALTAQIEADVERICRELSEEVTG